MRITPIPRALFADVRGGSSVYSVLGEAAVVFNGQWVEAPSEMMFNRISPDGTKVAAKAWIGGYCWIYDGTRWENTARDSYGSNGHIWTPDGRLEIVSGGPGAPSTGYAYWPVLTWQVYGPTAPMGQPRLYIAIDLGDGIYLGQGDSGGAVFLKGGQHYQLVDGPTVFINAHREGDRIVGGLHREFPYMDVVLFDLRVSDIEALPKYVTGDAPSTPTPDPTPVPEPEPPMSTPNELATVQRLFSQQPPAPNSKESCALFTRRVALALNPQGHPGGWGLLTKSPGETQHEGYAVDAIIYGQTQQVVDIIGGAEGPNPQPGWLEVGKRDNNHWAKPLPVGGSPSPTPVPDPQQPPSNVQQQIDALKREVETLKASVVRYDVPLALDVPEHGRIICADKNAETEHGIPLYANRIAVGAWEKFIPRKA